MRKKLKEETKSLKKRFTYISVQQMFKELFGGDRRFKKIFKTKSLVSSFKELKLRKTDVIITGNVS